jgi:hypothetical protein
MSIVPCCWMGCGECGVKQIDFVYSEETFPNGDKIIKSTPQAVSACCEAGLFFWDYEKDEEWRMPAQGDGSKGGAV